ncbi:hypothetical protein MVEN_00293500 [Mycena venus]|uniref:Ser-Thr-rich glycosyl-phosphatidyl-inositol-anchored membrane family-domain-containing protein n=1 Tax=Mycena venus TaxID=2733690 RepID=A0A8H7DE47_9AGAR|nr:hypothetical protein MVEN_00293500 [Mycena venus]
MFSLLLFSILAMGARALPNRPTELLSKRQSGPYNVTWPDSTVTWTAGNTYNVTWIAPHSGLGFLSLGTISLDIGVVLTAPFNLAGGIINVTIPSNISTRGDYIILLAQGDSIEESTYWAQSAPFGIGEATTTSGTEMSLDGSTFQFSRTLSVATTPGLGSGFESSSTNLPSSTSPSFLSSTGSSSLSIDSSLSSPTNTTSPSSGQRPIMLPYGRLALLVGAVVFLGHL